MCTFWKIIFFRLEKVITSLAYPIYILKNHHFAKKTAIVLAYHNVSDSKSSFKLSHKKSKQYNEISHLNVVPDSFEKQMQYFYCKNFNVISLQDFLLICENKKTIPNKTVILTFDDGYKGVYVNAYRVLKKLNFPATIFLSSSFIGTEKPFPWLTFHETQISNVPQQTNSWHPLSWEEVQEMSENSISFGSHTMTHPKMGNLDSKQIEWEISVSKKTIEKKIRSKISLFVILIHSSEPEYLIKGC